MIFVSVGTQEFQFNRLLKAIDKLIEDGSIKEEVIAQIGYSDYIPQHYKYSKFTTIDEFNKLIQEARIIICHGGTGTIINSIKQGKKVIAFARLKKYNEHVDDHQTELIESFNASGYILGKKDVDELKNSLQEIENFVCTPYKSGNKKIVELIDNFIKAGETK